MLIDNIAQRNISQLMLYLHCLLEGANGPPGPHGKMGADGPTGPSGHPGSKGRQGYDGSRGMPLQNKLLL